MAAVTIWSDFGAKKVKSVTTSTASPSIFHEVMGPDAMILVFWMLSFKPDFSFSPFHSHFSLSWILVTSSNCFSSVQFSHSVVSDSLQPHELQHARPPCPSPTPGVHPNLCPSSRWCHPTISSSVIPFSSCPQSFPASVSFQMSQLFTSGGQSIEISASTSVLPMNIQGWFPLEWTDWSPCSPRDSQVSSPTSQFKSINSLALSFLHSPTLTSIHDHWKNHSLD